MTPAISQDALDRLEDSIKKLKTAYEKYFAGIERIAPTKDRQEIRKTLLRLVGQPSTNTAWRFRVQSLQATLVTHEAYWDRVTRQIEEGTYRRDLFLLKHRSGGDVETKPQKESAAAAAAITAATPQAAAPVTPATRPTPAAAAPVTPATRPTPAAAAPVTPATRPTPAATSTASNAYPESIHRLYDAFIRARQSTGDSRPLSIDTLAVTVKKQIDNIKAKHPCRTVEFKVTIKDGKAVLTAIPRQ
jgi:hypothetical protein